ncbi:MAG: methionine--tRNA ligase [Deltaproteobacteria bacterium]|nr:MAG: methionine--tRNA ligase [Deltaproteobacteria bacterium]
MTTPSQAPEASPFYITTPIYYVNAKPHLGHAYTTIAADVACRFHAMQGLDTYFLTGTDEHGDKIVEAAEKQGVSPREYVDSISALFRNLWPEMAIENDQFIRTTDPDHIRVVEGILQKIYDSGDIYFSEYEGLYCTGCERFYHERELVDGKCPDHEVAPRRIKEANYFFRMSKYQDWLIDHIQSNPEFIRPERYRNEILAFLRDPLEDLCISRPKTRLTWGITLPFDENYVTYVWFDALVNYLSALGYPDGEKFNRYWPGVQHIVAKDIIKPHGIYWPTMLKAAGIPLYNHLNVHGYWNVDQSKMSKSLGNVVSPLDMKDTYGLDAFRFFLMRDMSFGLDSNFSEAVLVHRINSDLANDLGNLFSRVLTMAHRWCGGTVPAFDAETEKTFDLGLSTHAMTTIETYEREMAGFRFHKALQAVWAFISHINKYIDVTLPWQLAKDTSARTQLDTVMYNLLESLRVITGLIYPVMPGSAKIMHERLGGVPDTPFFSLALLKQWQMLQPGTTLMKSIILFPRIDTEKLAEALAEAAPEKTLSPPLKNMIGIDDFFKVDLRVGTVVAAEPVPKSNKLLKLSVDLGEGEPRTVVSGIAKSYTSDAMIGKQVMLVANLKPAKLMGIESNGMVLACVDKKGAVIATLDGDVAPGTPVS